MSFIEVENLKYKYPHAENLALDDLSFSIERGEFIGIIGENGAGKSTLSQAFMGLVPHFYKGAYGGKIVVDGIEVKKSSVAELCQKVGLVFQNPFNQLSGAKDTVYHEIAFGLQNMGVPKEEMEKRIEDVLKLLDIEAYKDRNPFDLSGGQMQRVAIASVLVMRPEVMILDEPTSQLDPQGTEEVFKAVDTLTELGITIIMIEQKIEKMAAYCDRMLLMKEGKLIDFDTPVKILNRSDLADYGVKPLFVTNICKKYGVKKQDGLYPITLEEVLELKETYSDNLLFTDKEQLAVECHAKAVKTEAIEHKAYETIFNVTDLSFQYVENTPVLKNINLTLDNRPTAIIGQNGAGKTTLVKLLKGLLKPVNGTVFLKDTNIAEKTVATLAGQVGYVFQNPDDQIFKYSVLQEVMFGPLNIGMTPKEAEDKAMEALALVGLSDVKDRNPYDLELNERKMIAIASVVAMNPEVIILDEPTIAQDDKGREIIRTVIDKMHEEGKLVIAILHDMDFVEECFERIIVMAKGEILADGTAQEVFVEDDVLQKARVMRPYKMELYYQLWK